ncbi:hypothetical protein JL720_12595 [Aureococcus anophagefferens]|nr:hypothetical protein JL720_12595 [Aureococcus anophagefferens]
MAESAASIEGQLWLVFTFYTIRGNASDPERLTAAALSRLCKDCQMYSKAVHGNAISERQVEVACAALRRRSVDRARQGAVKQALGDSDAFGAEREVYRSRGARGGSGLSHAEGAWRGLTFREFLNALVLFAERLFPVEGSDRDRAMTELAALEERGKPRSGTYVAASQRSRSREEAFERLLMECVLPLASRRVPAELGGALDDADVLEIRDAFEDELFELFAFYAARSQAKTEAVDAQSAPDWSEYTLGSDERAATRTLHGAGDRARYERLKRRSAHVALHWEDFGRFARDFGLAGGSLLSAVDSARASVGDAAGCRKGWRQRRLHFDGFWETLVRCALVYGAAAPPAVPVAEKVKALLLFLYKNRIGREADGVWARDGYRAYGEATDSPRGDARAEAQTVLETLLTSKRTPGDGENEEDEEEKPVTLLVDDDDLGDARFTVADVEELIKRRPLIGRMLQLTIEATKS